jgi:hypothetical protein
LRIDASNVTLPVLLSPLPPVVLASGSSLSRTSGRHRYHNSGQKREEAFPVQGES